VRTAFASVQLLTATSVIAFSQQGVAWLALTGCMACGCGPALAAEVEQNTVRPVEAAVLATQQYSADSIACTW
jgi:hypothetical protein